MSTFSFDEVADLYSQSRRPLPDFVYRFVSRSLDRQRSLSGSRPVRYVDLATGTGTLVNNVPLPHDVRAFGVDVSAMMLQQARSSGRADAVSFVQGDVHRLPFADSSVDLVSCCQAVHLFDPESFYAELDRVLVPHGLFVIVTYDLIASQGSPARCTNDIFRSILAHDMWPGFSETGVHPELMSQLESHGLVPFETRSQEAMFAFDVDEWQQRIESSSFSLKIVPERVRQALLEEHHRQARAHFGDAALPQRQRCWMVVACRQELVDQVVRSQVDREGPELDGTTW